MSTTFRTFGRSALSSLLLAAAGFFALSGSAHAGLFDDDEARRAILDIRARIDQSVEQNRSRNAELQTLLGSQIEQLRRSMLDLNSQLETMRAELARMRGQDEQMAKDLADLQRRTKDLQQGVDDRLKKFEPQATSVDGRDFQVEPEEKSQFEAAVNTLRGGDFVNAASQFTAFQKRWPASGYHDTANFWLGNALYGKRDYKEAITTFRTLVGNSPDHARAPEAMLSIANCQLELKDPKGARRTLDDLVLKYPKSEAASAGRERLASLK
ncbi:tol-pal system protein YbgF [soil metagenome]